MDQDMQQYLDKAEVLIEALTYIQRFNRKIIVVKYAGRRTPEKCHQGCYVLEIGWIQTDHRSRRWKRDQ